MSHAGSSGAVLTGDARHFHRGAAHPAPACLSEVPLVRSRLPLCQCVFWAAGRLAAVPVPCCRRRSRRSRAAAAAAGVKAGHSGRARAREERAQPWRARGPRVARRGGAGALDAGHVEPAPSDRI